MSKKYDVEIVETAAFNSREEAEDTLYKVDSKLKFNIIATALSLVGTLIFFLSQTDSCSFLFEGILEYITFGIYGAGLIATIAVNPIKTLKSVFKVGVFGFHITPFILFDVIAFVVFLAVGVVGLFLVPVAYAGYNLYDAYRTKTEAEDFLTVTA